MIKFYLKFYCKLEIVSIDFYRFIQLAAVKMISGATSAPEHKILRSSDRRIIACHGISPKAASVCLKPDGRCSFCQYEKNKSNRFYYILCKSNLHTFLILYYCSLVLTQRFQLCVKNHAFVKCILFIFNSSLFFISI